jgi:hypothetical protein
VRALACVLACVALVGAAGCGGDDEVSDEATVMTTQPGDEATLGSEECLELLGLGAALAQAFTGTAGADARETSELLDELVRKAPDEIKSDVQTLANGYAEIAESVRELNLDDGETPSAQQIQQIQAAIASVDQAELQAASERLSAWAEENC